MKEFAAVEPPTPVTAVDTTVLAGAVRFGVRLAGVPVVFPGGTTLEYVPAATVFPLPLAPRRLLGLMQLRGHPVAVFTARGGPAATLPERPPVLVFGEPAQAAALVVDEPPEAVHAPTGPAAQQGPDSGAVESLLPIAASADGRQAARLAVFASALAEPVRDAAGALWWPIEPARLFEALSCEDAPGSPPSASGPAAGRARR